MLLRERADLGEPIPVVPNRVVAAGGSRSREICKDVDHPRAVLRGDLLQVALGAASNARGRLTGFARELLESALERGGGKDLLVDESRDLVARVARVAFRAIEREGGLPADEAREAESLATVAPRRFAPTLAERAGGRGLGGDDAATIRSEAPNQSLAQAPRIAVVSDLQQIPEARVVLGGVDARQPEHAQRCEERFFTGREDRIEAAAIPRASRAPRRFDRDDVAFDEGRALRTIRLDPLAQDPFFEGGGCVEEEDDLGPVRRWPPGSLRARLRVLSVRHVSAPRRAGAAPSRTGVDRASGGRRRAGLHFTPRDVRDES